ncbi:hypothetical protein CCS92_34850, partial [Methylobacterium radiotolerans]
HAVDAAERARIEAGQAFGAARLERLPIHPVAGAPPVVRVGRGSVPALTAIHSPAPVPGPAWHLRTLTPVGTAVPPARLPAWLLSPPSPAPPP